jgi:ribose transport system substrate-binding protein
LLALSGCSKSNHSPEERYFLVVTNVKIPYWQTAAKGLYQAATQMKVPAEMVGPDTYDPKAQRDELRKVIAKKPSGIMISAADPQLLKDEINAAVSAGIPVITIDSDAPGSQRLMFIGTNNYQAGMMGGRILAQQLQGKGKVVVFTIPAQPNLEERLHGYKDALAQYPNIAITQVVDVRGDPAIAFDKTIELVESGKAPVDAFVCLEATAGKEVAEVLDRKKVHGKVIVAMDTDEGTLEWIDKGAIAATIGQRPYTMAYYGLRVLDDLHHNKIGSLTADWRQNPAAPIPAIVDTGATVVDRKNVAEMRKMNTPPDTGERARAAQAQ